MINNVHAELLTTLRECEVKETDVLVIKRPCENVQLVSVLEMNIDFNVPMDWLEKIPQKSAFQEWNNANIPLLEMPGHDLTRYEGRKEGWNAALDAVLSLDEKQAKKVMINQGEALLVPKSEIESMRET